MGGRGSALPSPLLRTRPGESRQSRVDPRRVEKLHATWGVCWWHSAWAAGCCWLRSKAATTPCLKAEGTPSLGRGPAKPSAQSFLCALFARPEPPSQWSLCDEGLYKESKGRGGQPLAAFFCRRSTPSLHVVEKSRASEILRKSEGLIALFQADVDAETFFAPDTQADEFSVRDTRLNRKDGCVSIVLGKMKQISFRFDVKCWSPWAVGTVCARRWRGDVTQSGRGSVGRHIWTPPYLLIPRWVSKHFSC